jgi:hypothetical protein
MHKEKYILFLFWFGFGFGFEYAGTTGVENIGVSMRSRVKSSRRTN